MGLFDSTTAIFSYLWESKNELELLQSLTKAVQAAALRGVVSHDCGPISDLSLAILASQCSHELKQIQTLYKQARQRAKLAGKVLACALALRLPFKTQTVSIVAFSLGAQVAKSCLKTLRDIFEPLGQGDGLLQDIIQSVTFLAGACHFSKNLGKYKDVFASTVNGQVKNVYSKFDRMLFLYERSDFLASPIGRHAIELDEDEETATGLVQNYDVSHCFSSKRLSGGMGHLNYMERVLQMEILIDVDLA